MNLDGGGLWGYKWTGGLVLWWEEGGCCRCRMVFMVVRMVGYFGVLEMGW